MIPGLHREGTLAVIPARGGSKGLPRKNLRLLGGIPLIAYSICAARNARSLHAFVISTEDDEIADVAAKYAAPVVRRPPDLATDTTQNDAVVRHVLEIIGRNACRYIVLLQPTSPLRLPEDIDACLEPLVSGVARSAMTVTRVEHHPGKAVRVNDGFVVPYTTEADMETRRQDMEEIYRQNGAVYAVGVDDFLRERRFYLPPCRAHIMARESSVDIDEEVDLLLAELLLERRARRATKWPK